MIVPPVIGLWPLLREETRFVPLEVVLVFSFSHKSGPSGAVLLARMVFVKFRVALPELEPSLKMPPPKLAEFSERVQELRLSSVLPKIEPLLKMPPPKVAELPKRVQALRLSAALPDSP